jgi:DNA-binding MarR family transcriptional regulator
MPHETVATEFASAEESPGFLLWQIANVWQRRQRAALKPLDLTHVQFVLLTVLAWGTRFDDRGLRQIDLAHEAKTDPMMTSQVLRALAGRGLVERVPDPGDARANLVRVTSAGRDLANRALPVVEAVDRAFFGARGPIFTAEFRALLADFDED